MQILLRNITIEDLPTYKHWKLPHHKYHAFNGPYFKPKTEGEIDIEIAQLKDKIENNSVDIKRKLIVDTDNTIIGEVSWYWKSEETYWLEIGIALFDETNWGKGIGYSALKKWISFLFNEKKHLVRLGLTTWSGNNGMVALSTKLGMIKEAEYRKARILNGVYYDSVSYGILRDEWENN